MTNTVLVTDPSISAILKDVGRLTHVSIGCVDWNGRLRTKQLAVGQLEKALCEGTAITSAIFATDTAEKPIETGRFHDPANGYPDAWLQLDSSSVRRDPLLDSAPGMVILGQLDGEFAQYCPRAILAREVGRLAALDLRARCAFEVECHVLDESSATIAHKIPMDLTTRAEFTRMYSCVDQALADRLLNAIREATVGMGVTIGTLHTEIGGLLEAGLTPTLALRSADDLTLYKYVVKTIARQQQSFATFMAKLSDAHEAAGAHLNISLRSGANGQPLFHCEGGTNPPVLRHFIGGLQRYVPELFVLLAPYINSYKRFGTASFVPRTNSWGLDNKTAAYRVVTTNAELARIEVRVPGADVNPYLALAAIVAAGRQGVALALEPSAPARGNAWDNDAPRGAPLPPTLAAALEGWRNSAFARATFGAEFVAEFAASRHWQLTQFARAVTDWEVRQFAEGV